MFKNTMQRKNIKEYSLPEGERINKSTHDFKATRSRWLAFLLQSRLGRLWFSFSLLMSIANLSYFINLSVAAQTGMPGFELSNAALQFFVAGSFLFYSYFMALYLCFGLGEMEER